MIFDVVTTLKTFLQKALADLYQTRPGGDMAVPQIVIGALPAKAEADDFPFVIIRPAAGRCGDDRADVEITLIFGAHNTAEDYSQGFRDLANMITRTWYRLMAAGYLDGRFELIKPLTWRIGGENQNQPFPHFLGSMKCKFRIQSVLLDYETADDVRLFGDGLGTD